MTHQVDEVDEVELPSPMRIGPWVAGVVVAALVVAAVFWYSGASGGGTDPSATRTAPVAVRDGRLVVGPDGAATSVVVRESGDCAACRTLELATRDFLDVDAAQGRVQVTYDVADPTPEYAAALSTGARATRSAHRAMYDEPMSGAPDGLPRVEVDGRPLAAASVDELALTLQRRIAQAPAD